MTFSKYPTQLDDNSSLPETVDLVTPVKAEVVNRLRDAIMATQTELGVDPSGVFGTIRDRLDNINSLISTLSARVTTNEGELDGLDIAIADLQAQITALESDLASEIAALTAQIDDLTTVIGTATQVVTPIVSGIQLTPSTTFTAVGAALINPTSLGYPSSTFTIEVILQTTDSNYAVSFELFNITEGISVSHPAISTTSTDPTYISVTLTVGGSDLPDGQVNVLEGRLKLASGAPISDRAICKYAAIRSVPT